MEPHVFVITICQASFDFSTPLGSLAWLRRAIGGKDCEFKTQLMQNECLTPILRASVVWSRHTTLRFNDNFGQFCWWTRLCFSFVFLLFLNSYSASSSSLFFLLTAACIYNWPLLLLGCVSITWSSKKPFGNRQRTNILFNAPRGIWLSTLAWHPNSPCYVSELVKLVKFMQTHYSCSTNPWTQPQYRGTGLA